MRIFCIVVVLKGYRGGGRPSRRWEQETQQHSFDNRSIQSVGRSGVVSPESSRGNALLEDMLIQGEKEEGREMRWPS